MLLLDPTNILSFVKMGITSKEGETSATLTPFSSLISSDWDTFNPSKIELSSYLASM